MEILVAAGVFTLFLAWPAALVDAARTSRACWSASGHARWATIYLLLFIPPIETIYYWAVLRRDLSAAARSLADRDLSDG